MSSSAAGWGYQSKELTGCLMPEGFFSLSRDPVPLIYLRVSILDDS